MRTHGKAHAWSAWFRAMILFFYNDCRFCDNIAFLAQTYIHTCNVETEGEISLFNVLTSDKFEVKPRATQLISSQTKCVVWKDTDMPKAFGEVQISTHFKGELIRWRHCSGLGGSFRNDRHESVPQYRVALHRQAVQPKKGFDEEQWQHNNHISGFTLVEEWISKILVSGFLWWSSSHSSIVSDRRLEVKGKDEQQDFISFLHGFLNKLKTFLLRPCLSSHRSSPLYFSS